MLRRYRDGSYLSQIGAVRVRVIECEITIATSAGRHTGVYRLATTLLITAATRRPRWSPCTTSAGKSKPLTLS